MKNHLSTAIIATALALLVPNNGAEAVGTLGVIAQAASVQPATIASLSQEAAANVTIASATDKGPAPYAWIMALGFLGFVAVRRLRGD